MTLAIAAKLRACRRGPSFCDNELGDELTACAISVPCGVASTAVCIVDDNACDNRSCRGFVCSISWIDPTRSFSRDRAYKSRVSSPICNFVVILFLSASLQDPSLQPTPYSSCFVSSKKDFNQIHLHCSISHTLLSPKDSVHILSSSCIPQTKGQDTVFSVARLALFSHHTLYIHTKS